MSERFAGPLGKRIVTPLLAATLAFLSGCTTYTAMPPRFIRSASPVHTSTAKTDDKPIDYGTLTWQEAIEYVQSPEQAQDYLDRHFRFDASELKGFDLGIFHVGTKGESFKYNHSRAKGVCLDYATSAAALLAGNGYDPLLLLMKGGGEKHAVYLYRTEEGLYGALGNTPLAPQYDSIESVVVELKVRNKSEFEEYCVVDLDRNFGRNEWISGDVDLQRSRADNWIKLKKEK